MTNAKRPFAILAVVALICAVGIPAWAIWKRGSPSAAMEPIAGSDRPAQQLFQTNCGACHTLAAAGTDGVLAPNLDVLLGTGPETKQVVEGNCTRVLSAIENGVGGRMPAGILQGQDAQLVANFVARNVAYVNNAPTATSGTSGSSGSTSVSASQVSCKLAGAPAGAPPSHGGAPAPKQKPKPPAPAPSPAGSTVNVSADPSGALAFQQTSLTAQAGKVTIDFTNQSPVQHNVTVADPSGKVLGATPTFTGGKKSTSVSLKPGTYTFYCSVPGHEQAGMKGTLTVR
jgi:plastocyanin/mono/diheme cytochrome c family protein